MNLREASVEILRRLRTADEEAASVGPESQARFDRKVAALEVTHSDEQQTQLETKRNRKNKASKPSRCVSKAASGPGTTVPGPNMNR